MSTTSPFQQGDLRLQVLCQAYEAGEILLNPRRITLALDLRGLHGPQVDIACRAREPEVDLWESGLAQPDWEQLLALAELTQMPVHSFFLPDPPEVGPTFLCAPQDVEPCPASSTSTGPAHSLSSHWRTRIPRPSGSGGAAAADAAAATVLAARERRRRQREAADLIPAPPGWRQRR